MYMYTYSVVRMLSISQHSTLNSVSLSSPTSTSCFQLRGLNETETVTELGSIAIWHIISPESRFLDYYKTLNHTQGERGNEERRGREEGGRRGGREERRRGRREGCTHHTDRRKSGIPDRLTSLCPSLENDRS